MTNLEKFLEEHGDKLTSECYACEMVFGVCQHDCPNIKELFEELNKEYKPHFTKEEKVILENIDKRYSWIVRNKLGDLVVSYIKPIRSYGGWTFEDYHPMSHPMKLYNHLFQHIKFSDNEPVNFREVLKNE